MSSTPSNSRTFAANTGLGIKLTPSNSPFQRTPRSPNRNRSVYESGLSLRRIIGTTVNSPTGFDCLPSARIFAYTAGAAAVVVELEDDLRYSQRFFRARPTAVPVTPLSVVPSTPGTPSNTANDSKNRGVPVLKDIPFSYSPSAPNASRVEWNDSPSSRTWTSRERIKAATCLSISRDGRFLAVGETGYSPRVLIFSLNESSDSPLLIFNEHTFGVRAVAFSPDQRFLASLGAANDGFLYVWSINPRTGAARLHSSNKCTSFVKAMIWMGNSLITVGTRHVKVWRPLEEYNTVSPSKQRFMPDGIQPLPIPSTVTRTLAGRNCLLGTLVEATFTCAASITDRTAIVCSEKGDICLLDDTNGQKLIKVAQLDFGITCIAVARDDGLICLGGRVGQTKTIKLDDLLQQSPLLDLPPVPLSTFLSKGVPGHLCAMAFCAETIIIIDSQHAVLILKNDATSKTTPSIPLASHCDAVLGVQLLHQPNAMDAEFLTWSAGGNVLFWDLDGRSKGSLQVEVEAANEEDPENQCQIVRASQGAIFLVTGDRKGILTVLDLASQTSTFRTKAHGSEIQDIAIHQGNVNLVATGGRDRMVQIFRQFLNSWMLVQTLDDHTGSVCSVSFAENGEKLISCSADRTIQIRRLVTREVNGQDMIAAIPVKIITLRATPVSMALSSLDQPGTLLISLMDRTVSTYDIISGRLVTSFRASDTDGIDAVVMDALVMGKPVSGRPTILAGVSGTDKSVRVYDALSGKLMDREWGHTSAVTDVALLETSDRTALISTGSDSTIMIWDLCPRSSELPEILDTSVSDREESAPKETVFARPPLRRVLSKAELAEFTRPSPSATPTGRGSPPRQVRRKTSKYALGSQFKKNSESILPDVLAPYSSNAYDDMSVRRNPRPRSRSPPSPRTKANRQPSLADVRGRTKSTGNLVEYGSLNTVTDQMLRNLRGFRKKLSSTEAIREEVLQELDQELRLTAKALGEKTLKTKAVNETVLAGLLDQYSERLVSIFDEKLRLSLNTNVSTDQTLNSELASGMTRDASGSSASIPLT